MKKGIRSKRKSLLLVSLLATLVLTSSFALLSYSLPTNILGFLPLGTTINYNIYETTSRIGTYVTFNISLNLKWNGTAFQVSGKSVVHTIPQINSNTTIENVSGAYPYPLSMWSYIVSAGTPNGFLAPNQVFTSYNGIPAIEFTDYNNYTYFSLQYMIPLKSYYYVNLNPQLNVTFSSLIEMKNADLSFYVGSYKVYSVSFNYAYDNYPVTLNFLVASPDAEIHIVNYSNLLGFNIIGKDFVALLVPITTFNDMFGIGKFIYNNSAYFVAFTYNATSTYFNTSNPLVGSYIPGTNYYMISVPSSANLTIVFNNYYTPKINGTVINPTATVSTEDIGNTFSPLYIISVVIIVAIVSFITYKLRRK
ncbi:hypothetical protein BFU36_08410 [Sulfolobus sp. A20]|uniref:hypothetical protein n=2 Tax=Sulfolobaceae TaxID=118883 RepID=UPI000845C702|nr:hypothetical protein [Sulfolobus sp. A20]TRM74014.1 hypothetical protein DJ523_05915 [Sulfolobus sp. E5]TRM77898.1 hypothetical protein DJ532_03015 [Sulfolobus sp. A20-N-F8]TRM81184.1 hypothetical protein DJ524_04960 [Sulfolobus sp. D5]TRM88761.1 hypothetical protein DJ521_01220 [Sulfolobus sp. E3]TRM97946.1 hypothetical protein DMP16_00755 [Sulfolobus sp. B1]TRM98962.1 hypothetical protein DJ527_09525 [Sulfolobus sp. F1]TRN02177.1 hypothetical protein DJ530_04595 [Sulfolobus sp. E1]